MRVSNVMISFFLGVVTLNSFISGVESLNTSLLLTVQRLAKTAENSSKESAIEREEAGVNETSPGNVLFLPFTLTDNISRERLPKLKLSNTWISTCMTTEKS